MGQSLCTHFEFYGTCMIIMVYNNNVMSLPFHVESLLVGGAIFSGGTLPSTLTCVSSNLPATTVEWTFALTTLSDADMTSVLTDPMTSQYTHTVTLTERQGGEYRCSLSAINDDSMMAVNGTASLNVLGKNNHDYRKEIQ